MSPRRPVIPEKDPSNQLELRSANLHVRQWELLDRVAKATGRKPQEVLRFFVDWAYEAWLEDQRASKKDDKKR